MARIKLIIFPNEDNEQSFEIEAACITVGSTDDNDISLSLPSISPHHFKIERRKTQWFIVDLRSKTGTFINEDTVSEAPLERGTIFRAGDCHMLFDVIEQGDVEEVESNQLPAIAAQTGIMAGESTPCWRCRQPVPFNSLFCPACGADQRASNVPSPFVSPIESVHAPGAGLMPIVAFVCSLFGPLLFGFGWLIGIILGFISLSLIRRRGGHITDVRRAHYAIYIGLTWFIILGAGIGWWLWSNTTENRIKRNEKYVIEELQDIAVAETYLKLSLKKDQDNDGLSEYGDFRDLVSNNYGHVEDSLAASPELFGYRFSMLRADEEGFTCVAEPVKIGLTGKRTFMIREKGDITADSLPDDMPLSISMKLKPLKIANVLDDRANELVRDLHGVAAEALRNKQYEKAQEIVKGTRNRFPTADAISKLDSIEEKSNPFVVEIRAREMLSQSSNALARGQLLRGIETLQTLRDTYSTFSGIQQVEEQLRELVDRYAQQNEQYAQELLKKALDFDIRMEFDNAEAAYRTVINRYKDTTAAADAEKRIALLADRRKEKSAAALMQEAFSLNLESEYEAIYSRLEQLKSAFAHSASVSQGMQRIDTLEKQAKARIQAAEGKEAYTSNNYNRTLLCFQNAVSLDPALLKEFEIELGWTLIYGVSNALAASDFNQALAYADQYQKLHLPPDLLSIDQVDKIRLAMARLSAEQGHYEEAAELLRKCGERLSNNYEMSFLAGQVFLKAGEPEKAAQCLKFCMSTNIYAADATPLLLEASVEAAYVKEKELVALFAKDPEMLTIARTYSIALPGVSNTTVTSTWQNLCVALCDDVEMTYELLTYSGAEADLFLEKKRARSELDAQLKKLRKLLLNSSRRRLEMLKAANGMAQWWDFSLSIVSNYPAASLSSNAKEYVDKITQAQKLAAYTVQYLRRALQSDNSNISSLLDYLNNLVYRLENKQPLRNMLGDIKRYLSDERTPNYYRTGMNALAALAELEIDPQQVSAAFSSL